MLEAQRENDKKVRDSAFKDALRTIEGIISKAQAYSSKMLDHEGTKYTDEDLHITQQPTTFSGGKLRDYQLEGFRWLARRAFLGESVIIADEMGLGKTIQVLAYIAWMRTHLNGPTLIICPLSTLGNWMDEIHRFTPGITAVRYHGTTEERAELRAKYIPHLAKTRGDADMPLIVTTYDVAVKDVDYLRYVQWRCLAIDEGHKLKNEKGVVRRMLREYSRDVRMGATQVKILLTGTPVQNDMLELWSLCNFIMPSVFSDRDQFKKIYTFMGLGTTAGADYLRTQEQQHAIISKLHSLLERYMLRRTKAEVQLELPPKVEVLVYTPLTSEQIVLLRALETGKVTEALETLGWTDVRDPNKVANVSTVNKTMNLRKVCCHPYEFAEPAASSSSGASLQLGLSTAQTDQRIITTCGKMIVLDKMLRKLRKDGHKVLIFSQFTTMLDILCDYFSFVGEGALGEYRLLTGATPAVERDSAIREFNGDKDNKIFAFLLSTKAGGLGINLVSADTVIFYDSDWNPKQDDQAQDRAHRIGQVRPVVVYRLVTEGASVERRMMRVAAGKGALGRMVLREGEHLLTDGGSSSAGKRRRSAPPGGSSTPTSPAAIGADDGGDGLFDEATGLSKYGKVDERLLSYWLRADIEGGNSSASSSQLPIMRGIPDAELTAILHRARALQAGQRVAKEIESKLLGTGSLGASVVRGSSPASPLQHALGARSAASKGARKQTAALGVTEDVERSLLSGTKASIEAEIRDWEAIGAAAPYTPSKGAGYEFVYHQASKGLLPSTVQSTGTDAEDPALAQVRSEISALAAEVRVSEGAGVDTGAGHEDKGETQRSRGKKPRQVTSPPDAVQRRSTRR